METLQQRIDALGWYHRIELPGGIATPGEMPLYPDLHFLPADLTGKRILDVGTWDGYWTFECLKRGAAEVVAIDDFSDALGAPGTPGYQGWQTFDLCADALQVADRCSHHEMSLYDLTPDTFGTFDWVLLFGVLYHLRYPLFGLDTLAEVCTDTISVESAACDDFSPYEGGLLRGYPGRKMVMEFYPAKQYAMNATNWWAPTMYCLAAMVQAAGFPNVKARKPENLPLSVAFCRAYVRGRKA